MNATAALGLEVSAVESIVAVDLAKNVFQLAVADSQWRLVQKHRFTRTQFERFFVNRNVSLVMMEACGSAHHWGAGSAAWASKFCCCTRAM